MTMALTQVTTGGVDENINIDSNTLKVDGTNNRVGIGEASPDRQLHITNTTDTTHVKLETTSSTGRAQVQYTSPNAEWFQGIVGASTSGDFLTYTADAKNITWYTSGSERLRIDSSGNVGIGTTTITNPYSQSNFTNVNIDGTWGGIISFKLGGVEQGWIGQRSSGNQEMILGASSGKNLLFATNGNNERMRIDSSGRVGIGCTPSSFGTNFNALEIHSPSGTASYLALTNSTTGSNGASNGFNILTSGNDAALLLRENGFMSFSTNDTERMRIQADGVVRINQSGTGNIFRIQNTTSDESSMLIQNSSTGYNPGNGTYIGIGSNESSYFWNYQNEPVIWGTNNAERMRLSNTGDVSIGTSSNQTGSKLNVYGAIGSANTRFACTEHGKGASGTYTSIVFDFAVGGSPATVIFETRAYGYNQDAVDHMFGAYSSSHNKVIRDNNSSGMSVAVTFPGTGGVTHRVTISGSITHPVAAVKATAGGLASSIDLLSITFS